MAAHRLALAGLIAVSIAGCGPESPLDVVMNQYPTNLRVGGTNVIQSPAQEQRGAVAVRPPVTVSLPAPQDNFVEPPLPTFNLPGEPVNPSIGDCGTSVLTHTSDAATGDAPYPPAAGQYAYRLKGNYDADGQKGTYPPTGSTSQVSNVTAVTPPGGLYNPSYTYDVTERDLGGRTTTVSYEVTPENAASNAVLFLQGNSVPANDPAGIYITGITSNDPASITGSGTFTPSPPIRILPIPAAIHESWTSSGGGSGTETAYSLAGLINDRTLIDACGKVLEGWTAHVTGSFSSATGRNASIDWTYSVGTEYGGLILQEAYIESGSNSGVRDYLDRTATISAQPVRPGG